jgi:hypothetical protein
LAKNRGFAGLWSTQAFTQGLELSDKAVGLTQYQPAIQNDARFGQLLAIDQREKHLCRYLAELLGRLPDDGQRRV